VHFNRINIEKDRCLHIEPMIAAKLLVNIDQASLGVFIDLRYLDGCGGLILMSKKRSVFVLLFLKIVVD